MDPTRRTILNGAFGAAAWAALGRPRRLVAAELDEPKSRPPYRGPNVIVIRFGGGVRRQETIADPRASWCPYLVHELLPRGVLFPNMTIADRERLATSHGQGTLNILTGRYDTYRDVEDEFLGERFEAKVPTVFEYLRKAYDVPEHRTLIVNGEDRTDEEFYSFSNHHLYGVNYRSRTLSLYWFKVYLLRAQLGADELDEAERASKQAALRELEALDYRGGAASNPEVDRFWERWRAFYGDTGLKNPRGDALLTELAVTAMKTLRPRLMLVNYQDPDYVHWGNPNHYTWGIRIIDRGIRRLVETAATDDAYRDRTAFVIVPDCGRNANPLVPVPYQHHFNSNASRAIFAFLLGPGIARGKRIERPVEQTAVAGTVGALGGFATGHAASDILAEALG